MATINIFTMNAKTIRFTLLFIAALTFSNVSSASLLEHFKSDALELHPITIENVITKKSLLSTEFVITGTNFSKGDELRVILLSKGGKTRTLEILEKSDVSMIAKLDESLSVGKHQLVVSVCDKEGQSASYDIEIVETRATEIKEDIKEEIEEQIEEIKDSLPSE